MATCKDCIHSGICSIQLSEHSVLDCNETSIRRSKDVEHRCLEFRDGSRFLELPCKVGDTVYFIKGGRVMSDTVIRFVIDRYAVKLTKSNGADIGYTTQFGERIFLTREEAEQALKLKGRENNG